VQDTLGYERDQSWVEQGLALKENKVEEVAGCRMWSELGEAGRLGCMREAGLVEGELILNAVKLFGVSEQV
jgi:hypothetical protein